jgi:hypothetical protein
VLLGLRPMHGRKHVHQQCSAIGKASGPAAYLVRAARAKLGGLDDHHGGGVLRQPACGWRRLAVGNVQQAVCGWFAGG